MTSAEKKKEWVDKVNVFLEQGMPVGKACKEVGISWGTFYNYRRQVEGSSAVSVINADADKPKTNYKKRLSSDKVMLIVGNRQTIMQIIEEMK